MLEEKDRAQLLYFVCQIVGNPRDIEQVNELFKEYLSIIEDNY